MKEKTYKFIKTQNKTTQHALFEAIVYREVYGELPEEIQEKYLDILSLLIEYEEISDGKEHSQGRRGAPKGNRNNMWCRKKDEESKVENDESTDVERVDSKESDTNEAQLSTNQSTKEHNSSTNEVQFEYNSSTKEDTKEKESEKENVPPSHTLLPIKEKEKEKENVRASEVPDAEPTDLFPIPTTPTKPKVTAPRAKRSGTFSLTIEELSDIELFLKRFPFIERQHAPAMMKWLKYKKERQQSYKSDTSLKTCYNHYLQLCKHDVNLGMQVVEASIGNNWSGLFELKNNNRYGTYQQTDGGRAEREAAINARISELLSEPN